MRIHEFTLILTTDPNADDTDRLYGCFSDGTIATVAGVPQVQFHRQAESLEQALRSAIGDIRGAGFTVERVEIEPDAVLQTT